MLACVFPDVEAAGKAFDGACAAASAALLADSRSKALVAAGTVLDGCSWSKGTATNVVKVLTKALVACPETGETNKVSLVVTLDSDGNPSWSVLGSTPRATSNGGSGGGKVSDYLLDGKPLSNKLLLDAEYADTVAGKVARNKYKPFGVTKRNNGEDYSATTAWNALHACKHDPVLKPRLTLKPTA